jgi:hypothetical protein
MKKNIHDEFDIDYIAYLYYEYYAKSSGQSENFIHPARYDL